MRPSVAAGVLVAVALTGFLLFDNFSSKTKERFLAGIDKNIEFFLEDNPIESTPEEVPASQYYIWFLRSRRSLPATLLPEDGYEFSYSVMMGGDVEVSPEECMNLRGFEAASCIRLAFIGRSTGDPEKLDSIVKSAEIEDARDARNLMAALVSLNGGEFYVNDTTLFLCGEVFRIKKEHPPEDACEWTTLSVLNRICTYDEGEYFISVYEAKDFKPQSFREVYCLESVAEMVRASEFS